MHRILIVEDDRDIARLMETAPDPGWVSGGAGS